MHDPVADVLRQRAALGTGAGAGIAVSVVLHGTLTALAVYAAMHATPPSPATMLNIKLAPVQSRAIEAAPRVVKTPPKPVERRIEEPKPEPPKTAVEKPPEKNTVPLSPFGRSAKKGSENPAPPPRTDTAPPTAATSTAPVVPIGGSGVTGLEGGDFPYTLYLEAMQRKIGGNWFRPQLAGGAAVIVYLRIQRDGTITDVKVETSSGNPTFDRAARSAVLSSSPLNPLPFAYNGTFLGVHLTFR
jgi:protein TonB